MKPSGLVAFTMKYQTLILSMNIHGLFSASPHKGQALATHICQIRKSSFVSGFCREQNKTQIEPKSLIVAQIERWRHALHMQVER